MKQADIISAWKPVVAIAGPTAIGKSRIGIEVAKMLNTEILTADSRQVYRGMDIGTDKPSIAEQRNIPHRLIDLVDPDQSFNAGDFRRHAIQDIARLHRLGLLPLVIGGTGFYIRALLRGLCPGPPANWLIRSELAQEAKMQGPAFLYEKLQQVDPELAQRLHPNDQPKVQRALEVYRILGTPLSVIQQQHRFDEAPYPFLLIGLTMKRQTLYQRIETRVDWEIQKGLVEETQSLMSQGFTRELGSMKGLGYRQFSGFLAGDYSYEEAVRLLKRDTRHFAKRQMTWFQKESEIQWMTVEESDIPDRAAAKIVDHINQFLSTFVNLPFPAKERSHFNSTQSSG
ncbi:tRNA (adenosine(37)-N6)-dimethylallyltransferase MiaA [Candidatus Nitrospira allomarina]|jgi:tRNA dimethylallyltransferase|uniref:tRNA dimethylallyltransferase n=1 Tax=Candidatus Nitrospira allomarina TaxID=3020900 RepID=A0AA96GEI5_9BACT|nr:tRNA (adenosine(37)-N6)-dimethylallyltransferase MiaA [Candidatus Nitrospira allomarina]WNM58735.1 tRNA (adenosine(37)-N6)-dimethylallyltransferase MiaA [Candidatus Nitrospira allomarina]